MLQLWPQRSSIILNTLSNVSPVFLSELDEIMFIVDAKAVMGQIYFYLTRQIDAIQP